MATKYKKGQTKKSYENEWKRIERYIKKLDKEGYEVDRSKLPTKLSRPMPKSVENLRHDVNYLFLRSIAYREKITEYGSLRLESKTDAIYEERARKHEAQKAKKKIEKGKLSTKSIKELEDDFMRSLESLGVDHEPVIEKTGKLNVGKKQFVPIADVGIKATDVYYRWKQIAKKNGYEVYQPKHLDERVYLFKGLGEHPELSGLYVLRHVPSVEGNAIEALATLLPKDDYYKSSSDYNKWAEMAEGNANKVEALINSLRNIDENDQRYNKIVENISNNIGEIYELMYGLLYKYETTETSSANFSKLYRQITGETMPADVADSLANYETVDL